MVLFFARLRFNQRSFGSQMRPRHATRYFLTGTWGGITAFMDMPSHKFHRPEGIRTSDCFAERSRPRNYTQPLNVASHLAGERNPILLSLPTLVAPPSTLMASNWVERQ